MTKAQTLLRLKHLRNAEVLDALVVTYEEWRKNSENILEQVRRAEWSSLAVRSSSRTEDQAQFSQAGKYLSLLDVAPSDVCRAITDVFSSFGETLSLEDEVLLQPMLKSTTMSGVLFTKDPNGNAPYYVINFVRGDNTAAVTSGLSDDQETVVVARCLETVPDQRIQKLLELSKELEEEFKSTNLDIEFAFSKDDKLVLFQVRPLVCVEAPFEGQEALLALASKKFSEISKEHSYLSGKRSIFGVMPDWNPAEIIGVRPRPLALSLYKELITDHTWAYQRDNYGYKNLRSFPLIIDFLGQPYVDIRVSFNSFLPKGLEDRLSEKLVDHYLDTLEKQPHLHDKVEFEIVHSCYAFDTPERLRSLEDAGFLNSEIGILKTALKELTNGIIRNDTGLWIRDSEKIDELKRRHDAIFFNPKFDAATKIFWMLEDCKRYGTLPFAGLARAGFVAIQILNSMVTVGVISEQQRLEFLNSLDSVGSQMTRGLSQSGRENFLASYGHLRPGTYDITSPRYDETPDKYFKWDANLSYEEAQKAEFTLSLSQMQRIEQLLLEHGLEHNVVGIFNFLKAAIEGREYSKFVFTKTLSNVLSLLKTIGDSFGLSSEDVSYVDIRDVLKNYTSAWDLSCVMRDSVVKGKERYKITSKVNLPPLITSHNDFYYFSLPSQHPNFITHRSVTASTIDDLTDTTELRGKILFIPSADPGFDWIFTHAIAGFITMYGGVNSHMAIRAGELSLPGVIGAGEKLYHQWAKASVLHLDCANHKVEIVR